MALFLLDCNSYTIICIWYAIKLNCLFAWHAGSCPDLQRTVMSMCIATVQKVKLLLEEESHLGFTRLVVLSPMVKAIAPEVGMLWLRAVEELKVLQRAQTRGNSGPHLHAVPPAADHGPQPAAGLPKGTVIVYESGGKLRGGLNCCHLPSSLAAGAEVTVVTLAQSVAPSGQMCRSAACRLAGEIATW
jgi:hypothetical protein